MLTDTVVWPVWSVQAIVSCLSAFFRMIDVVPTMAASVVTDQPALVAQAFRGAQASLGSPLPCMTTASVVPMVAQLMTLSPLGTVMPSVLKRPQRPSWLPDAATGALAVLAPSSAAGASAGASTTSSYSALVEPPFISRWRSSISSSMSPPQQQHEPAATIIPATGIMIFIVDLHGLVEVAAGMASASARAAPCYTTARGAAMRLSILLFAGCTGAPADAPTDAEPADASSVVPYTGTRAPLDETTIAGRAWRRGVIHLHSHYSHDACDGEPMPGGVPDEECLAHLRAALCDNALDFAMITDHPAHAAEQEWEDLLLSRDGDEVVDGIANRVACPDGRGVLTMPGIEDELMPVGLDRPVADTAEERDRLYNGTDAETLAAEIAAGATVLQAHTEGQELTTLYERQANGLSGVEIFNLHAMVDPDIREEHLDLDSFGYIDTIGPFLSGETDAEPDLAFLGFFQEQGVSLERWDALNRVAPTVGTAGTDAHENALPNVLSDGERVDSYRRMMAWFSNIVLTEGDGPQDVQAAIAAGRLFVAFEILGTPTGFHVGYGALEMGGTADVGGTLEVTCPTLAATSPQDGDEPEITATVYRDGVAWQTGCGSFAVTEPGVYRVRVDIVPHHLAGFLDDQTALIRSYPWLYSNAIRVGL